MIRLFTTAVLPGAGVVPGNGQPAFGSAPVLVSSMALMLLPSTSIDNNEPDLPLGSEFEEDAETSVDFRITNPTGTGPLAVSTPVVSAAVNCAVTVDPAPAASVAAGGQTEFTLNITPADAGAFSFTLTIANDSPDKNPFVVNFSGTAVAPPSISAQSADAVYDGISAQTLSVTATGSGLSYQWYTGASGDTSSPIGGATNATYDASPANPTRYWCRVTNAGGTADSTTKNILTKSSSTFTFDLDPENGITVADTDKITAAASQGSVALSLTNDGGANRPVLVTGDTNFNSQKTIRFNNSNYFYQAVTWTNLLAVGTKHIFIVARVTTLTADKVLLSDSNVFFQVKINAAGTGIGVYNNGSEIVSATLGANTTALIEVTHTGGNITVRVNNGSTSTAASGDTTGIGIYINVATANGFNNFVGEIGRMFIKNTVFTGEALACVRGYLGNRYNVAT